MESLWEKFMAGTDNEVHVIPIAYYDTSYDGKVLDKHDESAEFPEYLNTESAYKYDFENEKPDIIVIQVPYDEWNSAMTVHEFFYTRNLLQYTDELVYIPCFEPDDPETDSDKASTAISVFIEQPAVISADRVLLKTEKMRDLYIKKLAEHTDDKYRDYLEQKIILEEEFKIV